MQALALSLASHAGHPSASRSELGRVAHRPYNFLGTEAPA